MANAFVVLGAGLLFLAGFTFCGFWWILYGVGAAVGACLPGCRFRLWRRNDGFPVAATLVLHVVFMLLACGLASRFMDVSWDGLETHQRAVLLIREGWNIVLPQDGWLQRQAAEGIIRREPLLFTEHLNFSSMYVLTSLFSDLPFGLEGGKGYRIMLLFMVSVLASDLARRCGISRGSAIMVGLFVALNPVCLYQLWVLMMDFDVAVYSSLAIFGLYTLSFKVKSTTIWMILLSLAMLIVTKRSGLAIAVPLLFCLMVFGGGFLAHRFLCRKEQQGNSRSVGRRKRQIFTVSGVALLLVLIGGAGTLFFSLSPSSDSGKSLYSLSSLYEGIVNPNRMDARLGMEVPESHRQLSRPSQFVRSLFEATGIYRGESVKTPFTWNHWEWETFRNIHWPGHGSGGFGPLFSGVLILSLIAGLLALRPFPPVLNAGSVYRAILFMAVIGVCFVLPSWWARWVPFVWLIPLFFLLPPLFPRQRSTPDRWLLLGDRNHALPSLCSWAALVLAMSNSAILFAISSSESYEVSRKIDNSLDQLSGQTVYFNPGRNIVTKRWLMEREIDYRLSEERGNPLLELKPSTARLYQFDPSYSSE